MKIPKLVALSCAALMLTVAPAAAAAPSGHRCRCTAVTSVPPPTGTDGPFGITQGPGGTWYGEGGQLVRVRPDGRTDIFPVPDADTADVGWLTHDGHGLIWFSDRGNGRLGVIDAHGRVAEYTPPAGPDGAVGPGGIVADQGVVWFTDSANSRIGRFDIRSHRFTMFAVPTADAWPLGITMGPDGALWFVERSAGKVGRMTVHGAFTEWALDPNSFPNRIIVGPDHALWFTELDAGLVGRITLRGALTETPVAGGPVGITLGPDRRVYVALWNSKQLGQLNRSGELVRTWSVPGALLVASSHHQLWLTDTFSDAVSYVRPDCTG